MLLRTKQPVLVTECPLLPVVDVFLRHLWQLRRRFRLPKKKLFGLHFTSAESIRCFPVEKRVLVDLKPWASKFQHSL